MRKDSRPRAAGAHAPGRPQAGSGSTGSGPSALDPEALADMIRDKDAVALQSLGGAAAIADVLGSSASAGMPSDAAIKESRSGFGTAVLVRAKARPFWRLLLDAFKDVTLVLLFIAAVLTAGFAVFVTHEREEYIQGGALLITIAVVSLVSAGNTWSQQRAFQSLARLRDDRSVRVLRGGHEASASVFDLVVGDVLMLDAGDVLPADGVLLAGDAIQTDESAL